jgi:glycosyltransferase involved in cell wall biosynthesis
LKIAFFCFFEPDRISGPSNSITMLAKSLSCFFGFECSVFTTSSKLDEQFTINDVEISPMSKFLRDTNTFDFVVLSGIFDLSLFKISQKCREKKIPYVISLRSNLMRNALKKSPLKKFFALLTYTGYLLFFSKKLHYLNLDELNNSFSFGKETFVARNGLSIDVESGDVTRENKIVFIGRLDISHKGLDLLLDSLKIIQKDLELNYWSVLLIGPDSVGDKATINKKIHNLNLNHIIKILNAQTGVQKNVTLSSSKVFVHPSRYEGQPQAVIEAMAMGLIPVVTPGSNMAEHIESFFPVSTFNKFQYSALLLKAIKTNDDNLSQRISFYAKSNFNWRIAAQEFKDGLLK